MQPPLKPLPALQNLFRWMTGMAVLGGVALTFALVLVGLRLAFQKVDIGNVVALLAAGSSLTLIGLRGRRRTHATMRRVRQEDRPSP